MKSKSHAALDAVMRVVTSATILVENGEVCNEKESIVDTDNLQSLNDAIEALNIEDEPQRQTGSQLCEDYIRRNLL